MFSPPVFTPPLLFKRICDSSEISTFILLHCFKELVFLMFFSLMNYLDGSVFMGSKRLTHTCLESTQTIQISKTYQGKQAGSQSQLAYGGKVQSILRLMQQPISSVLSYAENVLAPGAGRMQSKKFERFIFSL